MTVGERIKTRRLELKLTQMELAKRAGYNNKSDISRMENGGDNIGLNRIERIAKALDVTTAYLMGWEDVSSDQDDLVTSASRMNSYAMSNEAMQIGLAYDKADEGTKSSVAKLLDVKRDVNSEVLGA